MPIELAMPGRCLAAAPKSWIYISVCPDPPSEGQIHRYAYADASAFMPAHQVN